MKDVAVIQECRRLAARAYVPYSKFHVAAAVCTEGGSVHRGVNMESASYGVTMCAEVGALTVAAAAGDLANVRTVYVTGGTIDVRGKLRGRDIVTPCGRCRQLIYEASCLSGHDIAVICANGDGSRVLRTTIRGLLPHGFGPQTIGRQTGKQAKGVVRLVRRRRAAS